MTAFDCVYETIKQSVDEFGEIVVDEVLPWLVNTILTGALYLTFPVWVFPYLIVKRRQENEK